MTIGQINNWSIDFLDPELSKCITGEIYGSKVFPEEKLISTSNIKIVSILNNFLIGSNSVPNILIETINNSKYIIGTPSELFINCTNTFINNYKLDNSTYTFNTSQGTINIIKWYLYKK